MLEVKLINQFDSTLRSCCGVVFNSPTTLINISNNKVGKTKTNSKIKFDSGMINTNTSAIIPNGLELVIIPNTNLYKKYGVIPATAYQVYTGDISEINLPVIALKDSSIKVGDPIAKIEVRLSATASWKTKLQYILGRVCIKYESPSN